MAAGTVYSAGWTLDDIQWNRFDPTAVNLDLLAAVKAAALVEVNALDYVAYLSRVFKDTDQRTLSDIWQWGQEEVQHGQALGRWCELADPAFNFKAAVARFQKGYKPPHFAGEGGSVRGSRRGEMVARCVVESGTSSYYSAMKDATEEPVLKEIAGRVAADEFRHYKLFYEILHRQDEPDLPFWRKLMVAVTRVNESDDDELAYAYYSANISPDVPYQRAVFARQSAAKALVIYQPNHIRKLVQMIAKAVGADPQGRMAKVASTLVWRMLKVRAGLLAGARAAA
ncbi:MAG TPA: hypothetical protein VL026_02855 [Rhizomicrobium sp.]|nr:hypothetical protein [Rhizomicrobium sp.]